MPHEGVIKFRLEHETEALEPRRYGDLVRKLKAWREIMAMTGMVGQDPGRYGGAGYGNVSARIAPPNAPLGKRAFLITGRQTAGKRSLDLDDFSVVERYDYRGNLVRSRGRVHPSSESMTHGAVYDLAPYIRCVLHAHCPVLWQQAGRLRLPTTDARVGYGTTDMALEVRRLYRDTVLPERCILSMGGHEDGILVFGRSIEQAGVVLVRWLALAHESAYGAVTPDVSRGVDLR